MTISCCLLILLVSCSRKLHTRNEGSKKETATAAWNSPLIVISESGSILTPKEKLPPEIANRVDLLSIARAYTPVQRQNLIYRFKMVPPRVLFIPDSMKKSSAKGDYCVFKGKFWYWKKEDGLFYLDATYYQ